MLLIIILFGLTYYLLGLVDFVGGGQQDTGRCCEQEDIVEENLWPFITIKVLHALLIFFSKLTKPCLCNHHTIMAKYIASCENDTSRRREGNYECGFCLLIRRLVLFPEAKGEKKTS